MLFFICVFADMSRLFISPMLTESLPAGSRFGFRAGEAFGALPFSWSILALTSRAMFRSRSSFVSCFENSTRTSLPSLGQPSVQVGEQRVLLEDAVQLRRERLEAFVGPDAAQVSGVLELRAEGGDGHEDLDEHLVRRQLQGLPRRRRRSWC